MHYLIGVLGFDERHVIKSLLRIGFKNVNKIYLIVPSGRIVKQTEEAIKRIKEIAGLAGVDGIEIFEVDVLRFEESVAKLRKLLMNLCAGGDLVIISLGGGMRALVIETLIAALLIPIELSAYVRVVADLEGGDSYIEFNVSDVRMLAELNRDELTVLSYMGRRGPVGPTDISRDLGIPKTTAWKLLRKLSNKGFLLKHGREYVLSETGKKLSLMATEIIK